MSSFSRNTWKLLTGDSSALILDGSVLLVYVILVIAIVRQSVITQAESYPLIHNNYALVWNTTTQQLYQYLPVESSFKLAPLTKIPLVSNTSNAAGVSVSQVMPRDYSYSCGMAPKGNSLISPRLPSVVPVVVDGVEEGKKIRPALVSRNLDPADTIEGHNLLLCSLIFLMVAILVELILVVAFTKLTDKYGIKAERRVYLIGMLVRRAGYTTPFLILILNLLGNVTQMLVAIVCYLNLLVIVARVASIIFKEYSVSIFAMGHVQDDPNSGDLRIIRMQKIVRYGHFITLFIVFLMVFECGILIHLANNFNVRTLPGFDNRFEGHFTLEPVSRIGPAAICYFVFTLLTDIHLQVVITKVYQKSWDQVITLVNRHHEGEGEDEDEKPTEDKPTEAFATRFSKFAEKMRVPASLIATLSLVECILVTSVCLVANGFLTSKALISC